MTWNTCWGRLYDENTPLGNIALYGFDSLAGSAQNHFTFPALQTKSYVGFCQKGSFLISGDNRQWSVESGQWFSLQSQNAKIKFADSNHNKSFVIAHDQHIALNSMGGPVESSGRLKYIDGCTDTLLYAPPILGDPCLNLLHFPSQVNQSMHTHPSTRIGIVMAGHGMCTTPVGEFALSEGMIFMLPKNTAHRFRTESTTLNVITYHPDSDWGPTHEVHPMINRTWLVDRT